MMLLIIANQTVLAGSQQGTGSDPKNNNQDYKLGACPRIEIVARNSWFEAGFCMI
ncbi:hypothetical protein MNBD_GAMMA01-502 [hydrothermal vent metagenome]|uniref:Uncharacterized protein n=1 Tax=hydrothermal vent metagenome TaxID=652676 RepID=A0A3B0UXJ1_9ZZZZ